MFTLGAHWFYWTMAAATLTSEEYYLFGNSGLRTFSYEPIEDENQIHTNTKQYMMEEKMGFSHVALFA